MADNEQLEMPWLTKAGLLVVGLIIVCYGIALKWSAECHYGYSGVRDHFATKTPYIPPSESEFTEDLHLQGCEAQQIWMIIRHGTRNPSVKIINEMKTMLPKLQQELVEGSNGLCASNFTDLAAWKFNPALVDSQEKILVNQGKVELRGLGDRFKKRFPKLFIGKYDDKKFKFKYTKTERAGASAKAFTESLFGDAHIHVQYPEPLDADPVLRFYKNCPKWKQNVKKDPKAFVEKTNFQNSEHMNSVLENVKNRLRIGRNLTFEEINTMYLTCAFETAWNPEKLSPWCAVFDHTDLSVLEYYHDLKHYWLDGYGHEITYKHACPPVVDFVESFNNRIANQNSLNVIAYFTHSGTLLKLLARLGLFRDNEKLLSDNYLSHQNRAWRTGIIDKFATNLAIVLHKCPTDYMISAFFQEKAIRLPACGDKACKFSEFKANMADVVNGCDVPAFCKSL